MHPIFETTFDSIISPRFTIPALATFFVWRVYRLLKDIVYGRLTALRGLDHLGTKRRHKIEGTAVICGGSISGILTARVCANHFSTCPCRGTGATQHGNYEAEVSNSTTRVITRYLSLAYTTFFLEALRRIWPDFDAEVRGLNGM
ncbi:hypothetical protein K439DRAFT_1657511 [Ramaria rubella]|nr:hypothetical protein K439DRAFT_1657511 [Ramaria rubella]